METSQHNKCYTNAAQKQKAEDFERAAPAHAASGLVPLWSGQSYCYHTQILHHPDFERMMSRIPVSKKGCFTDEQLALLSRATVRTKAAHLIDYRASIPFLGQRYYLTFLFGKEKRNLHRLLEEGLLTTRATEIFYSVAAIGAATFLTLLATILLYFIFCAITLEIPENPSFFSDFTFSG
jgi:hypothetical protein